MLAEQQMTPHDAFHSKILLANSPQLDVEAEAIA